jgi:hypothetical protein
MGHVSLTPHEALRRVFGSNEREVVGHDGVRIDGKQIVMAALGVGVGDVFLLGGGRSRQRKQGRSTLPSRTSARALRMRAGLNWRRKSTPSSETWRTSTAATSA